jgi:CRISPR/Cas system-associated exonuclease Cas4 (RecB family)
MVRPFENIKNIADAAQKIIEVISFVSKESPANRHPYTVSFIKAMIDGLHELQVSGLGPEKLSAADRYFRLIRNYIAEIEHPFPGTPVKGLQVLGFLETRNIKFDRVFLLDVNEGVLPSARKEDTTLPFAVRKALGLSTHEDQERKDRYYFDTLISGSRQADIFYVEGEDKEKSRFAERRIWELQKKSGKLEYPSDDIFFPVQFSQTDPRAVKKSPRLMAFVEREMTFSPSSLDGYLRCPLKYYYGDILGLKAKTGVAEDPDPMGVGSLVHKILMNFFLARVGEPLRIGKADYQDMEKAIDEGFREDYPDADRGSVYLIKSQARRQLKILLEFHDKRFNNIKILECENRKTASQPYRGRSTVSAELKIGDTKSVTVRGKIDRVDDRAGRIYIIDYKTGYWAVPNNDKFVLTNREDWSDTLVTVQLPAYIFLYSANNPKVKVQEMNAGLMLLGGKAIEEVMLFDDAMPQDRRVELYGNYLKAIVSLINEIRDPERDFLPCADSDTCDWCDFKTICGRQWVV